MKILFLQYYKNIDLIKFVPTIDNLSQLLYYAIEVNYEKEKRYKFDKIPCRKK